jgi:hypothetical protein
MPDETPEQWAARSRREQGVSECVEDPATVADLAQAVLEASEEEKKPDGRDPPAARSGTTA